MVEKRNITKEDIFIKARMLSEGVKVLKDGISYGTTLPEVREIEVPDNLDVNNAEMLLEELYKSRSLDLTNVALGNAVVLDGCKIPAPIFPRDDSHLDLTVDGDNVVVTEQGEVLATGSFYTPHRPWDDERLSNGMPVESVLPGMSSEIVNILFTLSCNNYNTGKGCRYCGLFSNPVSRKINNLPLSTLVHWAKYQAEAVKILTDHGWRGILALSGGALPPSQRPEYLERLEAVITPIREALDEKTFSELNVIYNHYPPDDLSDMYKWKELGINGTSIDMEVADEANFPRICPGKHAYKPQKYWKEAQVASTEVFGPLLHTTTNLVMGIEPMSALVEGIDERLSKGVLPIPLTFIPDPGSAMADASTPNAEWLVEAAEKIADCYVRHSAKFIKAFAAEIVTNLYYRRAPKFLTRKGNPRAGMARGSAQLTHLSAVFDEVVHRAQKLPGVAARLKIRVA